MWAKTPDEPMGEDGCPFTLERIGSYLDNCAYHYLLDDEPPPTFGSLTLLIRTQADNCQLWIWTCEDSTGRAWFVVAGIGPHEPTRWAHANSQESFISTEDYLEFVMAEYRAAHGRPQ
jgi:hypothetical protein